MSASVTVTVKVDDPTEVGVPDTVAPDNDNPAGKVPGPTAHVYGERPPEAVKICEYTVPLTPAGSDVVVTASCAKTSIVNSRVAVRPFESVTRRVNVV